MWNLNKTNKQKAEIIDTESRLVITRGRGAGSKMGEGGQKVQTSSCKINKIRKCNAQPGDYGFF